MEQSVVESLTAMRDVLLDVFPVEPTTEQRAQCAGAYLAQFDCVVPDEIDGFISVDRGQERVGLTLRLVVWDVDAQGQQDCIRDIKEQYCVFPELSHVLRAERCEAFLRAWAAVLQLCLVHLDFGQCMPSDVWFPNALGLVRARTQEDFERAFRVTSRLGRWLDSSS